MNHHKGVDPAPLDKPLKSRALKVSEAERKKEEANRKEEEEGEEREKERRTEQMREEKRVQAVMIETERSYADFFLHWFPVTCCVRLLLTGIV